MNGLGAGFDIWEQFLDVHPLIAFLRKRDIILDEFSLIIR